MDQSQRLDSVETRISGLEAALGRLMLQVTSSPIALVYPEPLATPLACESGAVRNHERFFSLIDGGEALIKYTGAISIGLIKISGSVYDISQEFKQPLSIGRWVEIVRNTLLSTSLTNHPLLTAVRTSLVQANGKYTPDGRFFLEEFTNIRNVHRGHTSSLPDDTYGQLYLRYSSSFHDALKNCSYLKYPLIRIESADVSSDPISYDIRHIVGPPPLTRVERIQATAKLRLNSLYIWDKYDEFVDLHDLIIYRACPICNISHTFFLEKILRSSLYYHSYFGNHRFKT